MEYGRKSLLFCLGGAGYVGLELLWRGRSHGSMFLAGGCCFVILGVLDRRIRDLPWVLRGLICSGVITAVELAAGLVFNRDYGVWDYRNLPLNFLGQICAPFSALWAPLGMGAILLYRAADHRVARICSSLSRSSSRKPA